MQTEQKTQKANGLQHIAFIMDGNGRWAQKRGLPREYGHKIGADVFRKTVEYCDDIGIHCVTVYAFSTENWKRPGREISAIMLLFKQYLKDAVKTMMKRDIRIVFLGDKSPFPKDVIKQMEEIERDSAQNTKRLNIAMNYGGRAEIVHAVNQLMGQGYKEITEEDIAKQLYTLDAPMPDLIVRTGGEQRISNFLMWQSAYSELYFTDILWPDFTENDVDKAVAEFESRNRRFGGV
ncbi:MAG: di-trans,poly-cis-decaprenylcistransferase [Clostridiales bacterium]|nr:di-trans,poly-cis-decaprenylcistransferase [Clostridiales bacterium]